MTPAKYASVYFGALVIYAESTFAGLCTTCLMAPDKDHIQTPKEDVAAAVAITAATIFGALAIRHTLKCPQNAWNAATVGTMAIAVVNLFGGVAAGEARQVAYCVNTVAFTAMTAGIPLAAGCSSRRQILARRAGYDVV